MAEDIVGVSGYLDISDIIGTMQELADEFGKIEGVSQKTASKLATAFNEASEAAKKGLGGDFKNAVDTFTKAFEEARESAEKQAASIENTIDNLKKELGSVEGERSAADGDTKAIEAADKKIGELNAQIAAQEQLLSVVKSSLSQCNATYTDFLSKVSDTSPISNGLDKAREEANSLVEALATALAKGDLVHDEIQKIPEEFDKGKVSIEEVRKTFENYFAVTAKTADIASAAYAKQEEYVNKLKKRIEELNKKVEEKKGSSEEIQSWTDELKKLNDELPKSSSNLEKLGQIVDGTKKDIDSATEALHQLNEEASDDRMNSMLAVFGGNLMTKGAEYVLQLTRQLGEAVTQSVELARQGEGIELAFQRVGDEKLLQGLRDATHNTVSDLELMKAAVKFDDFNLPVEELGTMLAFAQQKAKDTGQSIDYLVDSIVNGLGRQSTQILDNLGLSQAEVKKRTAETGDMTKAVGQIIREKMAEAGDYVETAADRAAQATAAQQNALRDLGKELLPIQSEFSSVVSTIEVGAVKVISFLVKNKEAVMAMIAALVAYTVVVKAHTAATWLATKAQAAWNAITKASPWGLVAAGVAAATTAIVMFTNKSKDATAAMKQQNEEAKRLADRQKDVADTVGGAVGNVEAKFMSLQAQWKKLKSKTQKVEFIKDQQDAFNDLSLSIHSVADAQKILVDMAPKVVEALKSVAEAEAYNDLYKEAVEKKSREWDRHGVPRATATTYVAGNPISDAEARAAGVRTNKERTSTQTLGGSGGTHTYVENMTPEEVVKVNKYRQEQAKKINDAKEAAYDADIKYYEDMMTSSAEKATKAKAELGAIFNAKTTPKGNKGKTPQQQAEESVKSALLDYKQTIEKAALEMKSGLTTELEVKKKTLSAQERLYDAFGKAYDTYADPKYKEAQDKAAAKIVELGGEIKKKTEEEKKKKAEKVNQEAWNELLKEYGNFEQQRLAITEEYAKKIAEAEGTGNYGQAEILRQQRDEEISSKRLEAIKENFDWEGIFNDLDRYSVEYLRSVRQQLQDLMKDPNLSTEDRKEIANKLNDITDIINEKAGNTFHWINSYLAEQKRLAEEARRATDEYNDAIKEQIEANSSAASARMQIKSLAEGYGLGEKFDTVVKDVDSLKGNSAEDVISKLGLDKTSKEAEELRKAFQRLEQAEARVVTATNKVTNAEEKKNSAEAKTKVPLKDQIAGILKGVADDVNKYIAPLGDIFAKFGNNKAAEAIQNGVAGVNSVAGAAEAYATGDYMGAALKALDAVGSFGQALGLNMFGEESDKNYGKDMERLSKTNEVLTGAINDLSKKIEKGDILGISEAYDKQKKYLDIETKNLQEQAQRSLDSRKKGGLFGGGEASSASKMLKGLTDQEIRLIGVATGKDVSNIVGTNRLTNVGAHHLSELFGSMTPEEYARLKEYPELWAKILDLADNGHRDATEYLEDLAEIGEKYEEIQETMLTSITGISFDDMRNSFVSSLMDMEYDAKKAAEDISRTMTEALVKDLVNNEETTKWLKKWREDYLKALQEKDYKRIKELQNEYLSEVEKKREEAEAIKQATGYNDIYKAAEQQSATFNSAQNITYEQADSIAGSLIAQTIILEQFLAENVTQTGLMGNIKVDVRSISDNVSAIRETQDSMNNHLAVISMNTRVLPDMYDEVVRVRKYVEGQ